MTQLPKDKDVLLAIDANAIIHRAYHAYPESLTNSQGLSLNAVYGFTSMLLSVLSEFDPKYIVCAFDTGKPTFRHQQFPDYKAHRKPTDQSLIDQFPHVERVLDAFNIPVLKRDTFEADDILGDLSEKSRNGKWKDYGLNMVIVTGDKDLLQLVGDNIYVTLPLGNFRNLILYDEEETLEKMGVKPSQIVDYKALVGDPSDNIPGVRGVGVKGATTLLNKYGSVDEIYKHLDEIGGRQAELLKEGVEQMEMSRELAQIVHDAGVEVGLEECVLTDFDRSELLELFQEYEFRSLVNKLPDQEVPEPQVGGQFDMFGGESSGADVEATDLFGDKIGQEVEEVDKKSLGKEIEALLSESRLFCYYLRKSEWSEESTGELFFGIVDKSGQLELSKVETNRETAQFLSSGFTAHTQRETYFFGWEQFAEDLIAITDSDLDLPDDSRIVDLQLLGHMLSSGEKGKEFGDLTYKYLGDQYPGILSESDVASIYEEFVKLAGVMMSELEKRGLDKYSEDSIKRLNVQWMKNDSLNSSRYEKVPSFKGNYYKYEVPLSVLLGKMEDRGIALDIKKIKRLDKDLEQKVLESQNEIYSSVGFEFNVNSPKQLSGVLFDDLGLPQGRGKNGRSTREDILKKLEGLHPCVTHILEYREVSKIHNTYITPLLESATTQIELAGQDIPSVHTNYLQTGTSSGRLSSQDPNMQNLPAKGDWAGRVKECFVAREGYKLFSMDYSQIELRILADMSKDKTLVRDFKMDKDIHSATAARIVDKPLKNVTDKDRRLGKTINFGIVYGQTKYGLSGMLGISVDDADKYITEYFKYYEGVKEYLDFIAHKVRENGYVETMLGRRRYLSGLDSSNRRVQDAVMREAINMPIQGTAADVIKIAMIEIDRYLAKIYKQEDVFMLLQVHDELVFEVKEELIDQVSSELEEIFGGVIELEVPLVVHASIGDNLSELK